MNNTTRIASVFTALLLAASAFAQTSQPDQPAGVTPEQPPRVDPKAVELAERTLNALGGRDAWNDTRYFTWKFFGSRLHIWDKHTGNIRVEWDDRVSSSRIVVLMNLNTHEGNAYRGGELIEDDAERKTALDAAHAAWINDSYWMFMPYKLLDPGVNQYHRGEGETLEANPAEIIELTFPQGVGLTPQNKYRVYIGKESGLVEQWDFYREASQEEPDFQCAWKNWKRFGNIMLSDDRGEMRGRAVKHTDIAVFNELPESVFTDPAPIDLKSLGGDWGDQSDGTNS